MTREFFDMRENVCLKIPDLAYRQAGQTLVSLAVRDDIYYVSLPVSSSLHFPIFPPSPLSNTAGTFIPLTSSGLVYCGYSIFFIPFKGL